MNYTDNLFDIVQCIAMHATPEDRANLSLVNKVFRAAIRYAESSRELCEEKEACLRGLKGFPWRPTKSVKFLHMETPDARVAATISADEFSSIAREFMINGLTQQAARLFDHLPFDKFRRILRVIPQLLCHGIQYASLISTENYLRTIEQCVRKREPIPIDDIIDRTVGEKSTTSLPVLSAFVHKFGSKRGRSFERRCNRTRAVLERKLRTIRAASLSPFQCALLSDKQRAKFIEECRSEWRERKRAWMTFSGLSFKGLGRHESLCCSLRIWFDGSQSFGETTKIKEILGWGK